MSDNEEPDMEDVIEKIVNKKLAALQEENERLKKEVMSKECDDMLNNTENVRTVKIVRHIPLPSPLKLDGNMNENIEFFKKMFENYAISTGLKQEENNVQVSTLMSIIGDQASTVIYKIVENINNETIESIFDTLMKKLSPETNIRYERYIFNCMTQGENESYKEYFLRLKSQVKLCSYKNMEEELMLDKIICSIHDINMRERLWIKKSIGLNDAIQLCISNEEMKQQLSKLQNVPNEINKLKWKPRPKNSEIKKQCSFCGNDWHKNREDCPANGKVCYKCNKFGHFVRVCKDKRKVKEIINEKEVEDYKDAPVLKIEHKENKGVFCTLQVIDTKSKKQDVNFQLDTGASCNIIGEITLKKILNTDRLILNKGTAPILKAFGGTKIESKGTIELKVRRHNKLFTLHFVVVEYDHCPMLSAKACETLKLIQYCNKVGNDENIQSVIPSSTKNIIDKYNCVFEGLGKISGKVDLEITNNITPVKQSPRRIPLALREDLKKELQEMVEQGVITEEPGYTEWISNITIVKKNGKLRVCLDPTHLNRALKDTKQQLPTLDEMLPELNKAKVFSTLDAKKGFWMIQLSEQSSKLTAFWTPFGKFRYLRLPFGISTAMEIFQKRMLEVTSGLKGVYVLADDMLVVGYGETECDAQKDHDKNLKQLMNRLNECNVKLNKDKVKLCKKEIKFYGHILTKDGVKPDEAKVSAIVNMPPPENKQDVLRFLGMVTYLSRYIKNLSNICEPLRRLTRENEAFKWHAEEQKCYENLKKIVANTTLLKYYDPKKPVTIQTDSSSFALGCAMMQENIPVAFASKTLTQTQKNYAQIEKEMLAIVFACNRFDQYICGRSDVIVETDHSPLVSIFKKPLLKSPKRLQTMILSLQRYNFIIKYKSGKEMYLADTLSRAPESTENQEKQIDIYEIAKTMDSFDDVSRINELKSGVNYMDDKIMKVSDESITKIMTETKADDQLIKLKDQVLKGWPEKQNLLPNDLKCFWNYRMDFSIEGDIIMKGNQMLVPRSLRKEFLRKIHSGHMGIEATKKFAKEALFWPNMLNEIEDTVRNCEVCNRLASNQKHIEMKSHDIPKFPFEIISMDIFEIHIKGKNRRFLVTTDHFSDFFEIDEVLDLTSRTTILICKRNFSRYGIPIKVITDGATNFSSSEFQKFSKEWEFTHVMSSPHYPQSNGKAESSVKIAKTLIKKSIDENEDFYKMLLAFRNTPNKTDMSPAKRMMCRWLRCQVPNMNKYQEMIRSEDVENKLKQNRQIAARYYNRGTVNRGPLCVGEQVWYKKEPKVNKWAKGEIIEDTGNSSYQVKDQEGAVYRRNEIFIKPDQNETISGTHHNSIKTNPIKLQVSSPVNNNQMTTRPRRTIKIPNRFSDFVLYK